MRYFPMFLDMAGRTVLLAGGDEQIAQKARLLKRTDARLVIMSETLVPELAALVEAGGAKHVAEDIDAASVEEAAYVFIATEDDALDLEIADLARAGGAVVNVVDKPENCDMITPALVDRDPVVVAIGTEGAAPVLAKAIKTMLEQSLSPRLGGFIDMIRRQRGPVAETVADRDRLSFWNWAVKGAPWRRWLAGDQRGAETMVREAADAGEPPEGSLAGMVLIETPSSPDLLPLRAVQRLQDAAVILHGPQVGDGVLELARRDAERIALPANPSEALAQLEAACSKGLAVALVDDRFTPFADLSEAEKISAAPST
ncbi:MAG: NAD(P)-dependent oxidoreductase [Pseudomonadota bacterium]